MAALTFFVCVVGFLFGWKSGGWRIKSKRLQEQNERIQNELLESNRENFEMKHQLGLPPHRRLMLLHERDPEQTISDDEQRKERDASPHLGVGGGMPLLILATAAAAMAAENSKRKKEKALAAASKSVSARDLSALKARLKEKASR